MTVVCRPTMEGAVLKARLFECCEEVLFVVITRRSVSSGLSGRDL